MVLPNYSVKRARLCNLSSVYKFLLLKSAAKAAGCAKTKTASCEYTAGANAAGLAAVSVASSLNPDVATGRYQDMRYCTNYCSMRNAVIAQMVKWFVESID